MPAELVTWAEIDLSAIAHNVRALKDFVGTNVEVIAVVKANAYGHGAVPVSRAALAAGATRLAVNRVLEGEELRNVGITAPILVLGYTPPGGAADIVRLGLTPSIMSLELAQALSASAVQSGAVVPVHLKVDTGMHRYGVLPEEVEGFVGTLERLPGLTLEGIFTHLATADSADRSYARGQLERFDAVLDTLRALGVRPPVVHALNSAGILQFVEHHYNAVRPGIAIYGLEPSDEFASPVPLVPALTLKARVGRVRDLPEGAGIGYGLSYHAPHPIRAALVTAGYADGYHRILSNRGIVLIRGVRAPVVGRVSMDQIVVDASAVPDVSVDDEVVLIGQQGDAEIRAEEVARLADTINYEVATGILPRVVRVYKSTAG